MSESSHEPPSAPAPKAERDYDPMGKPETPMWRMRWFQVSLGLIVLLTVASYVVPAVFRLIYATRPVLTPVLVGLTLAYVLNPVVTHLHGRFKVPRPVTAGAMLASLGAVGAVLLVLIPIMLWQAVVLLQKIPRTIHELAARDDLATPVEALVRWLSETLRQVDDAASLLFQRPAESASNGTSGEASAATASTASAEDAEFGATGSADPTEVEPAAAENQTANAVDNEVAAATEPLADAAAETAEAADAGPSLFESLTAMRGEVNWRGVAEASATALDLGAGAVGSAFGWLGYASVFVIVAAFVFFFATWKFRDFVCWFDPYVPDSKKARTYEVLGMMDRSVSAFIRGRLIQASIMSVVLTIGLLFTDARPFALLLGVAGGVLGLVPYVGLVVWPATIVVACLLNLQDGETISLLGAVILPTVVFVGAQSLDAYVIEPVVQGKATNLDALTVLLVVLIGGSLAGLLGLLIAIPAAACLKILWREVISPELRTLAKQA